MFLFLLLVLVHSVQPFSITTTTASSGQTIDKPANSGKNAVTLSCRLELSPGDHWTSCAWSHVFPDVWGLTNSPGYVMCTVSSINGDGAPCQDVGNLKGTYDGAYDTGNAWVGSYVSRISHDVTENSCGLTINSPNANDTGVWKCHVKDNTVGSSASVFWSEINLYVANKSEVVITDPALDSGMDKSLWVDISQSRGRIQASCKSLYGVPPPEIRWYIDELRNRISTRDATITSTTSSTGESVTSTISMDLDEMILSSYGVQPDQGYFSFALGCFPEQGNYFQSQSGVLNPAEVMVFGKSSGEIFLPVSLIILLQTVLITNILS
ncbi:uncharacterized protein LOC111698026 isoform X2 [Eurytemora carolleeae]|uniref:uncharacterized protein LOC111698026 isoform X2 n=1 Tax=Eurytemora carolleeae TaxID=1294199 RepID=UPI000C7945E6|nr:uncharacterized protein LOC111698026 isoform X2 [Eurytemora carolleeae]|eukprot:XP_023324012.1 uncharacterized protein LOC111698026 isoform X2 [Eurytemora affinis]